ncbi:MAG: hypothetical protein HY901_32695 [Deltaproteobacteria bacterium]|nr:hypothetical protein [Deltaproteobacteria bacterium]
MRKLVVALAACAFLAPALALGQVDLRIRVPLPPVPPLVVVHPGVQVVEDFDEEVFFTGGFYWTRRDGRWFRAPSPRVDFVPVAPKVVPVALVESPPGRYKRYKKAVKAHEKAERKAEKEHKKHGKHR